MSNGSDQQNFELTQDGGRFQARFRTSRTGSDTPAISTPEATAGPALTHLVFTRDRNGRTRMYLDGEIVAERTLAGSVSDWEKTTLTIGNGPRGKRPWLGSYRLVAIYGRDLLAEEIAQNFRAGATPRATESSSVAGNLALFESKIAPLLASRCMDCHDSAVRQGGLDLSRHDTTLAGGDHGNAIVPGNANASLVWLMTMSDAMPQNRTPLTSSEKEALRRWIDGGAQWPGGALDPGVYTRGDPALGNWVRRLTVSEYIETIRSATGVDVSEEAKRLLPADVRADGFENTAYNLTVDLGHVEAYAGLAEIVAKRIKIEELAGAGPDLADIRVEEMGKRILRGPLTEHEVALYRVLADTVASSGGTFREAARYVVEAMLQSPRFLYRIEQQKGDGTSWPADAHELAARLSYIVWGAPPDAILSAAAASGVLHDAEEVRRQARRLLSDPRAVARSIEFIEQWLDLDRLQNLQPDRKHFPRWNPRLAADMRAETVAFYEALVWQERRPLADLLNAQFSYLTPRLARYYGLRSQGPGSRRYDLSDVPSRGGILTQGAVLTIGGSEASMVTRGLFVLKDLLFGEVGSPPPELDTSPVPASPGRSHRAIAMERVKSAACGGCHAKFEPLAFGLERFDGLGSYREIDEHGNGLREDGEILFPGTAEAVTYATAAEMMELLAASDRVQRNIARKLTQFAIGRPLVAGDEPAVERIHQGGQTAGGTYQSLIEAIITSDLVRATPTEL